MTTLLSLTRRLERLERRTPHWRGSPALPAPSAADARTVVAMLLAAGADEGRTPLATQLRRLLESAADPNQKVS